jgi:hypothetical protein
MTSSFRKDPINQSIQSTPNSVPGTFEHVLRRTVRSLPAGTILLIMELMFLRTPPSGSEESEEVTDDDEEKQAEKDAAEDTKVSDEHQREKHG